MSAGPPVRVDISSTLVRLAVLYVAADTGPGVCEHDGACHCVRVSDRLPRPGDLLDVLVVTADPAACQDAIDATLKGRVRSVILDATPEGLGAAYTGLAEGLTVIPTKVIELAGLAPKLSDRQRETLRLLARGVSSSAIAVALRQSESTSKRDIAVLLQLFDAPNRTALVSAAASLGFVASHRGPRAAVLSV